MNAVEEGSEVEAVAFSVAGDNIIVEAVERENILPSGLVIADVDQRKPTDWRVVGAGPDARIETLQAGSHETVFPSPGDTLILFKHQVTAFEMPDDNRELFVVKPSGVIGVVDE